MANYNLKFNNVKSCFNIELAKPSSTWHLMRVGFQAESVHSELSQNNEYLHTFSEAQRLEKQMLSQAKENYEKKYKQKPQFKEENIFWEGVLLLNQNHTMQDVLNVSKIIEKKLGYRLITASIHNDEGHFDDEGNFIVNKHAHLKYISIDENGKSMHRLNMNKQKFRDLQTEIAEALGMQRGVDKEISGNEHLGHKEYKYLKKQVKKETEELALIKKNFHKNIKSREDIIEKQKQIINNIERKIDRERIQSIRSSGDTILDMVAQSDYELLHDNPLKSVTLSFLNILAGFAKIASLTLASISANAEANEKRKQAMFNTYYVDDSVKLALSYIKDKNLPEDKLSTAVENILNRIPPEVRNEMFDLAYSMAQGQEKEDLKHLFRGHFDKIEKNPIAKQLEELKSAKEQIKCLESELKNINKTKREEMKAEGATRDDFAHYEEEIKRLRDELDKLKKQKTTPNLEYNEYLRSLSSRLTEIKNTDYVSGRVSNLMEKIEKTMLGSLNFESVADTLRKLVCENIVVKDALERNYELAQETEKYKDIAETAKDRALKIAKEEEQRYKEKYKVDDFAKKDQEILALKAEISQKDNELSRKDDETKLQIDKARLIGSIESYLDVVRKMNISENEKIKSNLDWISGLYQDLVKNDNEIDQKELQKIFSDFNQAKSSISSATSKLNDKKWERDKIFS